MRKNREAKDVTTNAAGARKRSRPKAAQRLGFLAGEIAVPDDFDRMEAREIDEMCGGKCDATTMSEDAADLKAFEERRHEPTLDFETVVLRLMGEGKR